MSLDLYTPEISALALGNPYPDRLDDPAGSSERRSLGSQVRACLLGQASATLLARHAIGRSPEELAIARDQLTQWLGGEGGVPDWPGIDIFTPGLKLTARHPSIRLAFEAAAEAAERARLGVAA